MRLASLLLAAALGLTASPTCHAQHAAQQPATPKQLARYPTLLVGKWQSLQDPKSALVITPTRYQEVYDKERLSSMPYAITNTCPDSSVPHPSRQEKDILVTRDPSDDTSYCYGIEVLTADRLTLTYLGRGNSLRFKRVK